MNNSKTWATKPLIPKGGGYIEIVESRKLGKNNVNFETGTINSKRELWPKNLEKTSKTVLKMKSVDAGITPFFFLG